MLPLITAIPSVLTAIANVAISIGPMIAKYAPIVLEIAGNYLPKIIKTVESVCQVLDIISPNDNAEQLGAKAMQADKKPENFNEINDYIDYLNKEVIVDKTTLGEEKVDVMARQVIGVSLMIKGISENLGTELSLPFIKTVSQLGLKAEVIIEMVKAYAKNDLNLDDYEQYIEKTLPITQLDKHSETLVNAYQKSDATLSLEQAEEQIMELALPSSN